MQFIKELAEYEKKLDEVVATETLLKEWIFEKKKAEVIFALVNDHEVGFVLFFHNFSIFHEYREWKEVIRDLGKATLEECQRTPYLCLFR